MEESQLFDFILLICLRKYRVGGHITMLPTVLRVCKLRLLLFQISTASSRTVIYTAISVLLETAVHEILSRQRKHLLMLGIFKIPSNKHL